MVERRNISDLSDRELRILRKRIRKQRILRCRILTLLLTVCLILGGAFLAYSVETSAKNSTDEIKLKYYTNVEVAYGDTVSEIAEVYIDYDFYSSMDVYLAELKCINHLDEEFTLKAGQKIIVPYYSSEYK